MVKLDFCKTKTLLRVSKSIYCFFISMQICKGIVLVEIHPGVVLFYKLFVCMVFLCIWPQHIF